MGKKRERKAGSMKKGCCFHFIFNTRFKIYMLTGDETWMETVKRETNDRRQPNSVDERETDRMVRSMLPTLLTKEETRHLAAKFELYSTDGKMSKDEFLMLFMNAQTGKPMFKSSSASKVTNDAQIRKIFELFDHTDIDTSHHIDLHEFLLAFSFWKRHLSPHEQQLQFYFKIFDAEGNGRLSLPEFAAMLRSLLAESQLIAENRAAATDADAQEHTNDPTVERFVDLIFNDADADHSGEISYEELGAWCRRNGTALSDYDHTHATLSATFTLFDTTRSGGLSRAEFSAMLRETHMVAHSFCAHLEQEIAHFTRNVFKEIDTHSTGYVDFDDFTEWIDSNPHRLLKSVANAEARAIENREGAVLEVARSLEHNLAEELSRARGVISADNSSSGNQGKTPHVEVKANMLGHDTRESARRAAGVNNKVHVRDAFFRPDRAKVGVSGFSGLAAAERHREYYHGRHKGKRAHADAPRRSATQILEDIGQERLDRRHDQKYAPL